MMTNRCNAIRIACVLDDDPGQMERAMIEALDSATRRHG